MKGSSYIISAVVAIALLVGCQHGRGTGTKPSPVVIEESHPLPTPPPIPEERPLLVEGATGLGPVFFETSDGSYLNSDEANDAFQAFQLDSLDPNDFDMPLIINDHVLVWMIYFVGPAQSTFETWVGRSSQWGSMISATLAEEGLPQDLLYLSMIESGFKPTAQSQAYAAGLWQFMKPTARAMGLQVDSYIDERLDPEKSTRAAARYITYLHRRFGDWNLALAAYNGGEGRVSRAMKRTGSKDYWTLCEKKALPRETCDYVPKILAAMILGNAPSRYGFEIDPLPAYVYDVVEVPGGVSLETVSLCTHATEREIRRLNPELKRPFIPLNRALYPIKVPLGSSDGFLARFEAIPVEKRTGAIHVISSGENLWVIARAYGVTVNDLILANNIQNTQTLQIGQELIVPGFAMGKRTGKKSTRQAASTPQRKKSSKKGTSRKRNQKKGKAITHTVQKGDSLWSISKGYGVEVSQLKSWNGLKGDALKIGQPLKVYGVVKRGTGTYTVRSGDSISTIAHRHGMSIEALKRLNGLTSNRIYPGDSLRVRPGTATGQARYHTVSQGDNLWNLSRQYGVDIASLKRWNNLRSDQLMPGDRLKVSP